MKDYSHINKRIAKNTILLYIRMLVVMAIALYTSRIVLQALGIEDFGLYNVVGGVVGLFSFLRSSMEKCTQRFFNVTMANDENNLPKVFSVSLSIHIAIMIVALLLAETIGLWFLNTIINIPAGREFAANIIYQAAVFSLCTTILSVPYSASIIAHERMGFFAVVSVLDAILKLAIALLLLNVHKDRLVSYGWLIALIALINLIMYCVYCRLNFKETKFRISYDKGLCKQMTGFISWNLLGQAATLGTNQGNSILVNMFHSVTANAAMSIGSQVNSAIQTFSASFQTAFNPQLTQSYAAQDYCYMKKLLYGTSKLSYSLMTVVALPIIFNIDIILSVWLKTVPQFASIFCILTICCGIVDSLSTPLNFCIMATGKIKNTQILTSLTYLLDLPTVYLLFSMEYPVVSVMCIKIFVLVTVLFIRLYYVTKEIPEFKFWQYLRDVVLPLLIFSAVSLISGLLLDFKQPISIILLIKLLVLLFVSCTCGYFVVLNKNERLMLSSIFKRNEV